VLVRANQSRLTEADSGLRLILPKHWPPPQSRQRQTQCQQAKQAELNLLQVCDLPADSDVCLAVRQIFLSRAMG